MQRLSPAEPASEKMTEAERLAWLIVEHLNALPMETTEVTSRSLKALIAKDTSSSTWTRAIEEAVTLPANWGWMRDGQSVRRMTPKDYGFDVEEGYSEADGIESP
jgi:hypothetical protein